MGRDIHGFKNVYQTITNIVIEENGDCAADPPQYFAYVQETLPLPTGSTGFMYVRQTVIHTAEPLVPGPRACDFYDL